MKKLVFLSLLFLVIINSCKKEEVKKIDTTSIPSVLNSAGSMPFVSVLRQTDKQTIDEGETEADTAIWRCTRTKYSITGGTGGDQGYPEFNPNADVIYPGAMLKGESLGNATPDPIVVKRAGGTISWDANNGKSHSISVDEVKKSTIQDAMNKVVDTTEQFNANFTFTYQSVYSSSHLAFEMGISNKSAFYDVKTNFGFELDQTRNSVLVKLKQAYYTMSFDLPVDLNALFHPDVTAEDLAKFITPTSPATYVSSVTYGRTYYMLFQSSSSRQEMEATLDAAFKTGMSKTEVDASVNSVNKLKNVKITVKAYGGDATQTFKTISNPTDMKSLFTNLTDAGTIGSGAPLSYVVRNVADHKVVATKLATDFDVVNCDLVIKKQKPLSWLKQWHGPNGAWAKLGGIGEIMSYDEPSQLRFILFSLDGKKFIKDDNGVISGPFSVKELFGANGTNQYPNPTSAQKAILDPLTHELDSLGVNGAMRVGSNNIKGIEPWYYCFSTHSRTILSLHLKNFITLTMERGLQNSPIKDIKFTNGLAALYSNTRTGVTYGINNGRGVDFTQEYIGGGDGKLFTSSGLIKDNWPEIPTGRVEGITFVDYLQSTDFLLRVVGGKDLIENGRYLSIKEYDPATGDSKFYTVDLKQAYQ